MESSLGWRMLRDVTAWLTVLVFVFPIAWWVLASVKPYSAIFVPDPVFFDFTPTLDNYRVTLGGLSRAALAIQLATFTSYALSRFRFRGAQSYIGWILSQRMMPVIAVAIPLFFMFR